MEAKELRIGNYVNYFDKTVIISKIELSHIGCSDKNSIMINCYNQKDAFKPIPLTEEWLLKFGFKDRSRTLKNKMSYGIEIGKMEIAWYRLDNKTRFQTIENGFIMKCVTYVHELQNLYFALTNEELTIKNL